MVLSANEDSLVGRAIDVSPYGICVATAPTASVRLGQSFRVEAVAEAGMRVRFTGEVRFLAGDRVGIETRELVLME